MQLRDDGLWREYQDALRAARARRIEQRDVLARKIDAARGAHRRRFKLRHHAIAAMPIAPPEKRELYRTLSFERRAAERRLRATIKGWRTTRLDANPGTWKEFLAMCAARGDQRAMRRLAHKSRGLVIRNGERQLRGTQSGGSHTSRGTILHNLPNGIRLREFPGSIELLGDANDEALEQLVHVAKQRFESKHITLLGRRDVQRRLARIAADRGLQIAPERER